MMQFGHVFDIGSKRLGEWVCQRELGGQDTTEVRLGYVCPRVEVKFGNLLRHLLPIAVRR